MPKSKGPKVPYLNFDCMKLNPFLTKKYPNCNNNETRQKDFLKLACTMTYVHTGNNRPTFNHPK